MEVPTFVLAMSMLVPATRNDMIFTVLFFLTRIAYHSVLRTLQASRAPLLLQAYVALLQSWCTGARTGVRTAADWSTLSASPSPHGFL